MPFVENLDPFFESSQFATSASYTPAEGGAAVDVSGIFDNEQVNDEEGFGEIQQFKPVFTCAKADLSETIIGGNLVLDGVNYIVRETTVDGSGRVIKLMLEDQS